MWFRNLQIYRLTSPFELSGEELSERLQARPCRECGSLELSCDGWEQPLGRHGTLFTHTVGDCTMICMRREEKVLPSAVINEQLKEKVETLEETEGRTVRRRERSEIKEEIVLDLLPKAFTRPALTYAYIDRQHDWLVVDTTSAKRAEELISLLRETLGSLPLVPLEVAQSPAAIMTGWLSDKMPAQEFLIGDECELRDPMEEGGVVRCRKQNLEGDEIASHLKAGKQVVRLSLEWHERLDFLLTEEPSIKRLKFLDVIQEEAAEIDAEDAAARFDVDFSLMTLELGRFIPRLLDQFGGLAESEGK